MLALLGSVAAADHMPKKVAAIASTAEADIDTDGVGRVWIAKRHGRRWELRGDQGEGAYVLITLTRAKGKWSVSSVEYNGTPSPGGDTGLTLEDGPLSPPPPAPLRPAAVAFGHVDVGDGLTREQVRKALAKKQKALGACAKVNEKTAVLASFTIDADAHVTAVDVDGLDDATDTCLERVIASVAFPRPSGVDSVTVLYALDFEVK